MSFCLSRCDELLGEILRDVGVFRYGVARAEEVEPDSWKSFLTWLENGNHASMAWMERHLEIRRDPRMLLEEAASVIVCAFPYSTPPDRPPGSVSFASYSLGDDYHEVIKSRLQEAVLRIKESFGGENRICVDSAPLFERYWACKSGLGFIGKNCQVIIPGAGSRFFLGTIVSTFAFTPFEPIDRSCGECFRCIENCPGKALTGEGGSPCLDARRCLSFLTIENRGEIPAAIELGDSVFGCDACQNVCPHNAASPDALREFLPRQALLGLTPEDVLSLDRERYLELFRKSSVKRARLEGLQRNAAAVLRQKRR